MHALADIQLPPCKVSLWLDVGVEAHILMEVKDSNRVPEDRALYVGTHNLSPQSSDNNRKGLLEVATKDDCMAT